MNEIKSGWLAVVFRWIAFIPVCYILTGLLELVAGLGGAWLFFGGIRSTAFALIVLVLGGLTTLIAIPFVFVMPYYGAIRLGVSKICPDPQIGAIIYGVLYVLSWFKNPFGFFIYALWLRFPESVTGHASGYTVFSLVAKLICVGITVVAVCSAYNESKNIKNLHAIK